ncbi:MAG: tape measure protein, partial [Tetragenococcus sp.]|nr:tape measure protein [Tetragenococcus sp.]
MADQEMGGVNISISADSSQAERQMAQFFDWFTSAGTEATKLSSSIGGVMNKMSQMGQAGSSSSKNVISSYNDVQRQAQKTRDTASQIGSALKKSADRGIAGYQTLTKGVKSDNAQMSKDTQAKFSEMEGSSKKSFDEMYRDSETFNSLLKESTKASFGVLGQGFRDLGNGFKSVGGNIKNVASSMGGWFKTAAGAIANAFRHPIQTMQSLGGIARDVGSKVSGFISSGFSMAKDLAISQLDKLKGGLSSIAESAKAAGNRAKNFFVTGFNGIVTGAGNILSSVGNTLSNLPDTARQAGANVKDWFVRNIKGIPGESDSIWTRIKNGVMSIPKKARNAGATIKEKLGNVWRSVKNASGKFLPGVKSDMKQNIDKPSQKSKMSVMDMAKAFGLVQIAGKAFNGLKNQMSGAINRMDTMNNSSRAFENMGFTAKETEGAMDGLDKALEGMPTPLDEAVQGVQLLASSTDDVGKSQKVFNSINDAILGFGGSTEEVNSAVMQLSQGFSKGKIQGEEWNSMINSQMGPALNAMADNMNMSTDEMREGLSDGTISIEEFQDQLIKLDEEGGGDLKALRQVAQDATDGIKTSFGNMGISIQRGIVEVIESFNDFVQDVTGSSIADWITRFGEAAGKGLSKIGDVLQFITPYIKDFINFLKDNGPIVQPIIAGIGAAFAAWATIKTATAAISGLVSVVKGVGGAFALLASPMGIFLALVAVAVAAGVALYQNWDTIKEYAGVVGEAISNAWGSAVDWIKEKWSGFTDFFANIWNSVAEATTEAWEWIKAAPGNAYEWLKEKWNGLVEFFVGLWTSVTETTAEMWAGIKEFFNGVVLGFKESWNGIVEFFVNLWNSVKETIAVAWSGIVELFAPIVMQILQPFMPMIEFFGQLWNSIKTITAELWNIIKGVIFAPVLAIINLVTGDFTQLKANMLMIWNSIKNSALIIWNAIKSLVIGYVQALVQTAKNLFNGMKNVVIAIWNGIKIAALTIWNLIKTGVLAIIKG